MTGPLVDPMIPAKAPTPAKTAPKQGMRNAAINLEDAFSGIGMRSEDDD